MPNFIQVPPNSTGLKVDMSELIVGSNTVERQNICLTDPASAVNIAAVQTKGIQGAYAAQTQDLKDSGRTTVCFSNLGILGSFTFTTTETMFSFGINKLGSTVAASSYTVTTGKTLRLQSFTFWASNPAIGGMVLNLRGNASGGAVTTTTNVLLQLPMVPIAWLTTPSIIIPDGFEIASGTSIGFSGWVGVSTGGIWGSFIGYEY